MKRKWEASFLLLAVGLLSLSHAEQPIQLGQGICGDVEGVSHMARGYDIRHFKFQKSGENGKRREILQWTCENKVWTLFNGEKIFFPDQFDTPDFQNSKEFDSTVTFLDHFEAYSKHESHHVKLEDQQKYWEIIGQGTGAAVDMILPNVSVGAAGAKFEFNRNCEQKMGAVGKAFGADQELHIPPHTNTIKEYESNVRNKEFHVTTSFNMKTYALRLRGLRRLKLEEDFEDAYNELPDYFLDNPKPFFDFIDTFGTHYMSYAEFGGRLKYSKVYESSHATKSEKEEIAKQWREMFETFKDTEKRTSERDTTKFYEKIHVEAVGGDLSKITLPYTSQKFENWQASIYNLTGDPIEVRFKPIIDLIANQSIKYHLSIATLYKIQEETLRRYKELLEVLNPNNVDSTYRDIRIAYERKFNEITQLLSVSTPANGSMHYVNMIEKSTQQFHLKFNNFIVFFENYPAYIELAKEVEHIKKFPTLFECVEKYLGTCKEDPLGEECLKTGDLPIDFDATLRTDHLYRQYTSAVALIDDLKKGNERKNIVSELQKVTRYLATWRKKIDYRELGYGITRDEGCG